MKPKPPKISSVLISIKTSMESFHSINGTPKLPQLFLQLRRTATRSLYTLFSLLLLLLLAYNSGTTFCPYFPFPGSTSPGADAFSPERVAGKSRKLVSLSSSAKLSSSVMYAVEENNLAEKPHNYFSISHKNQSFLVFRNNSLPYHPKRRAAHKIPVKVMASKAAERKFYEKVKDFFHGNSSDFSCKPRFFMTWISSLEDFGDREVLNIQSLFKSHPNCCLLIVSEEMDSRGGLLILRPFLEMGFKIMAISPDYKYLFKNTAAESWVDRYMRGKISPGQVSIGQNLSNLLRLGLLYKYGGIYLDTDVIVLKSLRELRNVIGAQAIDAETKNWSRLNNAVMIFDKGHPLLYMFIEEFALTFDGSKWGHNGPYLVSRVVSRVKAWHGYDLTVLPPRAFYPVDWSRIGNLFKGPRNESHSKWLEAKLGQLRDHSFAVHLWNKQSRRLKVEEGSIIRHILLDCCLFCNFSALVS